MRGCIRDSGFHPLIQFFASVSLLECAQCHVVLLETMDDQYLNKTLFKAIWNKISSAETVKILVNNQDFLLRSLSSYVVIKLLFT